MQFSVPSSVGLCFLSLFASTSLAAGPPKTIYATNDTTTETIVNIYQQYHILPILLDNKNYTALNGVFTKNVRLTSAALSISGLAELEKFFQVSYERKTTFHVSENVFVYDISSTTASVVSDGENTYFARKGNATVEVAKSYEGFSDFLVKEEGIWKIYHRNVISSINTGDPAYYN